MLEHRGDTLLSDSFLSHLIHIFKCHIFLHIFNFIHMFIDLSALDT